MGLEERNSRRLEKMLDILDEAAKVMQHMNQRIDQLELEVEMLQENGLSDISQYDYVTWDGASNAWVRTDGKS